MSRGRGRGREAVGQQERVVSGARCRRRHNQGEQPHPYNMEGNDHKSNLEYIESHRGKQEERLCVVSSNLQAGHLWGLASEIHTDISF